MDHQKEQYHAALKKHGLSNTKTRAAVFEVLQQSGHTPLSMPDLVRALSGKADRATAYRTVESLESAGIIKRLYIGWKYKLELSDQFSRHHHHITCIKCGKIHATHNDQALEREISALAKSCGFTIADHHIDIRGICSDCR